MHKINADIIMDEAKNEARFNSMRKSSLNQGITELKNKHHPAPLIQIKTSKFNIPLYEEKSWYAHACYFLYSFKTLQLIYFKYPHIWNILQEMISVWTIFSTVKKSPFSLWITLKSTLTQSSTC